MRAGFSTSPCLSRWTMVESDIARPAYPVLVRPGSGSATPGCSAARIFPPRSPGVAALGTHGTLFEKKDWHLALGPIANVAYYSNWTDRGGNGLAAATGTGVTSITVKDHYSANVGFGFRWTPIEFLTVYGGPFYNYETAKLESTGFIRRIALSGSGNNISADKSFGSRLGIQIPFKDQFSVNLEAQMKDYFSAGGWLSFNF